MSKAEQIGHLCLMIHANIDHCRSSHMDPVYGYISRLNEVAAVGVIRGREHPGNHEPR